MTALTPDCDPDLSGWSRPADSPPGGGLRSTAALVIVLVASVAAVTAGTQPGVAAYMAGGVAVASGLVLARGASGSPAGCSPPRSSPRPAPRPAGLGR